MPMDAYRTQCDQLVTHSVKGVNTNADSGGIRVVPSIDPNMPYSSVRFGKAPVALDYTKNATQPFSSSVATEQLDAVATGDFHRFAALDAKQQEECESIRNDMVPLLTEPYLSIGSRVSPRLRQILLDDGFGRDVSLTPLPSGGFSARLYQLINDNLETLATDMENGASAKAFFDEVLVKVGGDKAQNAGRIHLIGAMQQAYCFAVPLERAAELRTAIALHHRGISTRPPKTLLEAYGQFLAALRNQDKKHNQSLQRTDRRLNKEYQHIQKMVSMILARGNKAREKIAPHIGAALNDYASTDLPLVQQGLLNPARRDDAWKAAFSADLAQQIANASHGDTLIVGISQRSAESLEALIMEALS